MLGVLVDGPGCARSPHPSQVLLPTQLAVVAERDGAAGPEPVSLVLDLRRNSRDQLDVRISPGLRLWDGRHLWDLTASFDARGHGLRVSDVKAGLGGDVPLFGAEPLAVVGLTRRAAWVQLPNGAVFECQLSRAECVESAVAPLPMSHLGPGSGFALTLEGGDLKLRLPFAKAETVLLEHVQRLVGVHWVHETWLDHDPVLDRTYRGRGSLTAVARQITPDGDLHDWADAEPMVVDAPWQVQAGADGWSGPRDASFSIAVAHSDGAGGPGVQGALGERSLCFAGRVRDDDWMLADALVFRVGSETSRVSLELGSAGGAGAHDGSAIVRGGWFSRSYEYCVRASTSKLPPGDVPFSASFEDHDDASSSVISSASSSHGAGEGAIRVGS